MEHKKVRELLTSHFEPHRQRNTKPCACAVAGKSYPLVRTLLPYRFVDHIAVIKPRRIGMLGRKRIIDHHNRPACS